MPHFAHSSSSCIIFQLFISVKDMLNFFSWICFKNVGKLDFNMFKLTFSKITCNFKSVNTSLPDKVFSSEYESRSALKWIQICPDLDPQYWWNSLFLCWGRLERQDPEGKADCATYSAEELGRFSSIEALGINLILLINLFFSEKLCYYMFFYCMCFVYESG
jgi:hypothetical protein